MIIRVLAVGQKMPSWVQEGVQTYTQRMPRECRVEWVELAPAKRTKNGQASAYKQDEAKRILNALPNGSICVVLDERGQSWTTKKLADNLEQWMGSGQDVAIIIGGPDGLDESVKQKADRLLSLSALTMPHPMVRILLSEQLYRAWSVTQNHPYHRE